MPRLVDDPQRARQLAQAIASDLANYHQEKIRGIPNDTLFDVMKGEIEEGRALFRSRVTDDIYAQGIYDRAIVEVLIKSKGQVADKLERHGRCPRCGGRVRLNRDDLIDKRGFCVVCDVGFAVTPDTLGARPPIRPGEAVELARKSATPPTRAMILHSHEAVKIRPARLSARMRWEDIPIVPTLFFLLVAPLLPRAGMHWLSSLVIAIASVYAYHVIPRLLRREMVEVHGTTIVVRYRTLAAHETTIPIEEVVDVYVDVEIDETDNEGKPSRHSHVVKIARKERDAVVIGRGYGHGEGAAEWLERWIKSKVSS